MSNSSSARAVVERLVIDHVGHFGDGVALVGGQKRLRALHARRRDRRGRSRSRAIPTAGACSRSSAQAPERIAPFCQHFGVCGGCAIQHWEAERYRAWKRNLVVETLAQAKLDCEVDAADRRPWRWAAAASRCTRGSAPTTCSRSVSRRQIRTTSFPSTAARSSIPALSGALDAAWALAEPLTPTGKPLDIQITATDNGLDVDVRGSGPLPARMIATLSRVAEQHRLARLTRHGELVLMRMPPTIAIGAAQVTLPPGSFLQATAAGEEALAALVSDHCKRAKHIADLFCGVGPFALRLAAKARISAFDSDAGAVAALQKAAMATSGLKPVKAEARDLFRRPLMPQELRDFDAVVFDPPRQGAQAQAHAACGQQGSGGGRGVLQRRDLCARRAASWSMAATRSRA